MSGQIPKRGAPNVTIGEAISALLKVKRMVNLRPDSVTALRQYLSQFSRGRDSEPISNFTVDVVEDWFASRTESASTQASNVGRLSSLFSYATRRRWIEENPCDQMEKVRIDRKPPKILTPTQSAVLMDWCRREKPNRTAFFALSLYAGVRPHELSRLDWEAVNLEDGTVTIDAAASKVRRRRIVELEPTACAWLKWSKERGGRLPVKRKTRQRYLDQACEILGWETWPQDCLRHTAASYLLAKHKDAGRVAFSLGNSAKVLETNYKALVRSSQSAEFWAFTPDAEISQSSQSEPANAASHSRDWGVAVDLSANRFNRAEAALKAEPVIRQNAREKQRNDGYVGSVIGSRNGHRLNTLDEIAKLARCSNRTIKAVKVILQHGDSELIESLRSGKPGASIAGAAKRINASK